ncbi:MAG: transporter [Caulobacter sp.]|nr:transporter [Caulobacter sp.]
MDGEDEAAIDPQAAAREHRRRTLIVPLIIGVAILMQTLDSTLVATALPAMAVALKQTPLTLNLALTAYLLGAAIFMPVSGWAADRFGARTIFSVAIVEFGLSSLCCGLSQDLTQLVAARLIQGCAGAMLMPVGRLVLLRTATKAELIQATSILTVPALLGPVFGPPLGGLIVTLADWRWVFLINLPIAAGGLFLVNRYIDNVREPDAPRLDVPGVILSALALSGMAIGLGNLGRDTPPMAVAIALAVGGVAFAVAYVIYAKRKPGPVMDLAPFGDVTFRLTIIGGLFVRPILGATPYLLALLLQVALGFSALTAGLITFATAVGSLLMRSTARPVIQRFGFKALLVGNAVFIALSLSACALVGAKTPHLVIIAILGVHGFLRAIQFTCMNALAYADLEPSQMSSGSTIMGLSQQLGQSLGIGLCATLVQWAQRSHGGGHLTPADIAPAFIAVSVVSLLSLPFFIGLPRNAGHSVSGRTDPDVEA